MKKTILLNLVICGFVNLSCQTKISKEVTSSKESTSKQELANTLIPFRKGTKWGYSDVNKKLIVPPKYLAALPFVDGRGEVLSSEGYGFLDESGNEIVPPKYNSVERFKEGLALVKSGSMKTGKYGFFDKSGKEVVSLIYDDAGSFQEGLAQVRKDGKYGFIDKTGKEMIPLIYDSVSSFQEGLAKVKKGEKCGFIDKTGKEVIPLIYDEAQAFFEGLAAVAQDKIWRFIDKTGKEVLRPMDYHGEFKDGLAVVGKGELEVNNETYGISGKYGFIDKTGKEVVPRVYDYAFPFSEGLASVKKDKKWGFIDKTGKTIAPFNFRFRGDCSEGVAVVTDFNDTDFVFDKNGQELFKSQYTFPEPSFSDGLIKFYISSKNEVGFMDKTGQVVIKPKYYSAGPFKNGLAKVALDNNASFYIDKDGTEYYEP